jgi:hypothetical protein
MDYLIHDNTKWVDTGIKCPRCNNIILRETYNDDKPTDHFACERMGCTWTNYHSNIRQLIEQYSVPVGK